MKIVLSSKNNIPYRREQQEIENLRQELLKIIDNFGRLNFNVVSAADDDEVLDLYNFITSFKGFTKKEKISDIDKVKIMLALPHTPKTESRKIASYIESIVYGWQDNEYVFSNNCLRNNADRHCKIVSRIQDVKKARETLNDLAKFFLHKEYGGFTTTIFCYFLSSLFASKLNKDQYVPPYYLQLACNRNSMIYQLIDELIEICDVNTGLFEYCRLIDLNYKSCNFTGHKYYPTQSIDEDLSVILRDSRDAPIIISGLEDKSNYNKLMRTFVNMANRRRMLDLRDKFNVIPLFLCDSISSEFDNVLSIDLTGFDITIDYLNIVRKYKNILAAWIFKLIKDPYRYLCPETDHILNEYKSHLFFKMIERYIGKIEGNHTELSIRATRNVGFLNFFFCGFIRVYSYSEFAYSDKKFVVFTDNEGKHINTTAVENTDIFSSKTEYIISILHRNQLLSHVNNNIKDRNAILLAKKVEKIYKEFNVHIQIVPVDVKSDQYIFEIETLQNTKDADVRKYAETAKRRLKKYECFKVDLSDSQKIKLVVAKHQSKDNSLIKFFTHPNFTDPKKKLPYAIGIDEAGALYIEDMEPYPHMLIGGSSNSGKSTAIVSLLLSIAYKHRNGNAKIVIMDFLSEIKSNYEVFNDQPIMACPVITDPIKGANAIIALYEEMNRRQPDQAAENAPYIICAIDEYPKLFSSVSGKTLNERLKNSINELMRKGRHANIHFVFVTQTLAKDDIDLLSNANTRIAFRCSHYKFSINIYGRGDAARLRGLGQMILNSSNVYDKHLLGSYISEPDMKELLTEIKQTYKQKNNNHFIINENTTSIDLDMDTSSEQPNYTKRHLKTVENLLPGVIIWSLSQEKIANSRIQAEFSIGNNKVNKLLAYMEQYSLIQRANGNLGWRVIPKQFEEISPDIIELLTAHGYTKDHIINELNKRQIP